MAKNGFCYPAAALPENLENIINCHNIPNNASTMQELPENAFQFQGHPSWYSGGFAEDRVASSSRSHRKAEKRRRDRINAQLDRLRKLTSKSEKIDKAALLETVVEQVRDLKRKASDLSKFLTTPTEIDDVTIDFHTSNIQQVAGYQISHDIDKNMLIKATFCCEDRPDIITELIQALKGLNLTTIGADFACLGGRMKSILILYSKDVHVGVGDKEGVCNFSAIKQSLMSVLTRVVSWSTTTPNFRVTSKRQRFFFSS